MKLILCPSLLLLLSVDVPRCGAAYISPPSNVKVLNTSSTELHVSWSPPVSWVNISSTEMSRNPPVSWVRMSPAITAKTSTVSQLTYTVYWRVSDVDTWVTHNTSDLEYTIRDLQDCTVYLVKVTSRVDNMESASGLTAKTTCLNDSAPEDLVLSESGDDVYVSWTWSPTGLVVVFTVTWYRNNQLLGSINVTDTHYTINNVSLDENLKVCVTAVYDNCNSVPVCQTGEKQTSGKGLIIGLSIGIPAVLIIIAIIIYLCWRPKPSQIYSADIEIRGRQSGGHNQRGEAHSKSEELLRNEFYAKFAKQVYKKPTKNALNHAHKNRYADILPFDDTLVRVSQVEYINASYILGKRFIATQDPYPDQDDDFWQLIWDCDVCVIIRLSVDNTKQAVARYIDDRGDNTWVMGHDELSVTLVDSHNNGSFRKRTLVVSQDNQVKVIHHFHMTNWPERSVPKHDDILRLIMEARSIAKAHPTRPVLVHCGAGCGRSGTLIALWHMIDEYTTSRMANIVRTVESIREGRMSMVQTVDQYVYIYQCFEDFRDNRERWETEVGE
ncbi:receptor-type tyrosine-protein phosphatase H isoform X1 [Cherax quadricarinatus]|nr:receptor-type tyrosine-protein phosphatase H-like isoform X2 [Cherax quadricarinatus]